VIAAETHAYEELVEDSDMAVFRRGDYWWYEFIFAGRRVRESSKSTSKTVAKAAEQQRKRELEEGFNNFTDNRRERVRTIADLADEYLTAYKLRHPQSAVFAEYAVNHVCRILGGRMFVDCNEGTITLYQNHRLKEGAAPKSVNEEIGFLLRVMGDPGDLLRVRLRKRKMLKLKTGRSIAKAYAVEEKERMLAEAKKARSPHIFPAIMLALNAGIRDAELKNLTWAQMDLAKGYLTVGKSKTEAGEGRTIPLNTALAECMSDYAEWYREKFGKPQPQWYIFPFGKPTPSDPTRPVTTLKTAWNNVRKNAKVEGRWHDNRHTLITDLAESGAGDQTIMDIAGHVSKQMLKHYSHIRMQAKRNALEAIVQKPAAAKASKGKDEAAEGVPTKPPAEVIRGAKAARRSHAQVPVENSNAAMNSKGDYSELPRVTQGFEGVSPQKSPQSAIFEVHRGVKKGRKSKILIGSSGRTRTYNPSVNSRMLCH
jgi:integrase